MTYLSIAPEGLREAFITGGLPGLDATADDVYRVTYPRGRAKTRRTTQRYPMDAEQAQAGGPPPGQPRGAAAGRCPAHRGRPSRPGPDARQQHAAATPCTTCWRTPSPAAGCPTRSWHRRRGQLSFAEAPLYALVHEACYAQGAATRWSARADPGRVPRIRPGRGRGRRGPLLFTGEMIYPWMFEADPVLRPLRDGGGGDRPARTGRALYDPARLAANEVPAAAAVYFDDMYVPRRALAADRGRDPRPAALGDQRVRARRAAGEQRRGAGPAHRAGPRSGLSTRPGASPGGRGVRPGTPGAARRDR